MLNASKVEPDKETAETQLDDDDDCANDDDDDDGDGEE